MKTKIETIRHSLAHVMASSVQKIYPEVKFGIGPDIENGFYYDFEFADIAKSKCQNPNAKPSSELKIQKKEIELTLNNLPKIQKQMKKFLSQNFSFEKKEISKNEAKKIFKNQPYKLELIKKIKDEKISIYKCGNFIDLCAGPHIKSTKEITTDAFALTKIAGAYWQGDEKNIMLTRIYGVAFETKKELDEYLKLQEEAEKRDHRKLGKKLELFMFDEEIGQGLPIWLPKGAILRKIIEDYLHKELTLQGYDWLYTPHIGNLNLWKTSGHWNFYKENLYSPIKIDNENYLLKPMNCPFHVKVYNSKIRSHRDLPVKLAEFGTVYRYEKSGTMHGLTRVRGFTQDDAHIICDHNNIKKEVEKLIKHGLKILKTFGFTDYNIYLSTMPEKYAGSLEDWKKSTSALELVLKKLNLKYKIDKGGGVFYGPKIDIKIKDSLKREWQCTTVQFDFNLPEKFNMYYIDKNGKKAKPYMIHRALLGSFERFIGVLIEHYAGAFPFWLSPVQISIVPVGEKHIKYAKEISEKLQALDLRIKLKNENESVSKKIRECEIQKIPYLLVLGDKEIKSKSVAVRERGKKEIKTIKLKKFIENLSKLK